MARSTLGILIRQLNHNIDGLRRVIAVKQAEDEALLGEEKRLDSEIDDAWALSASGQMGDVRAMDVFIKSARDKKEAVIKARQELAKELAALRENLLDQFSERKKMETIKEQRETIEATKKQQAQQAVLDEMAGQRASRNNY